MNGMVYVSADVLLLGERPIRQDLRQDSRGDAHPSSGEGVAHRRDVVQEHRRRHHSSGRPQRAPLRRSDKPPQRRRVAPPLVGKSGRRPFRVAHMIRLRLSAATGPRGTVTLVSVVDSKHVANRTQIRTLSIPSSSATRRGNLRTSHAGCGARAMPTRQHQVPGDVRSTKHHHQRTVGRPFKKNPLAPAYVHL